MTLPVDAAPVYHLANGITDIVPPYLRDLRRWTAWSLSGKGAKGKPAKVPLTRTNDPTTWQTFEDACRASVGRAGIGFQMQGVSTVVGIDIDGCVDPTTGAMSQYAASLLSALPDTYAELSPSRHGVRIFAQIPDGTKVPEFLSREHGVECYCGLSARYLTVTGYALPGRAGRWGTITQQALSLLRPLARATGETTIEINLPLPATERIENWQELFDKQRLTYKKLRPEWREYLETGDLPGGRSEKSFGIACKLLEARYLPEEVFAVLVSAPGSWEAALDKRDQDVTRARQLIWSDIGRAQKVVRTDDVALADRLDAWEALGLKTTLENRRVRVQHSQSNAARILTNLEEWKDRLALDMTTGGVLLDGTPLDDLRFFDLQERVCAFATWEPTDGRQWWGDVIRAVADKNPINPREVELRKLIWDGEPRLDTWLTEHVAMEDSPLNRDIGRKWMISLVARWIQPGCKCDTVLILQGIEGARKNTLLEVIAGAPERVVALEGLERDDKLVIAKSWIAEMPESHLLRRADRNRMKGFITRPIDDYRQPYAALPVAVRRAFVIVGTANTLGNLFSSDQDGLRRFWPVEVKDRIDYEWVTANRDQILAEATLAYDLGEPWWFDESTPELRERVENAREITVMDEAVETLIRQRKGKGGIMMGDLVAELGAVLGYRPSDANIASLFEKHGIRRRRSATHRYWTHPTWVTGRRDADLIQLHPTVEKEEKEEAVEVLS